MKNTKSYYCRICNKPVQADSTIPVYLDYVLCYRRQMLIMCECGCAWFKATKRFPKKTKETVKSIQKDLQPKRKGIK